MTKKIISILALAFAIATPALNINTQAQSDVSNFKIVTATNGLNVRDKNCNRVGTIGYYTVLVEESKSSITCTINGKSVKMVNYATYFGEVNALNTYVAENFTKDLISNNSLTYSENFKVDATAGLNLRDENCKRVRTVKNGTILKNSYGGSAINICKAGNDFYDMSDIEYNGKIYKVASKFLKNA
jgi:hypothetical protein